MEQRGCVAASEHCFESALVLYAQTVKINNHGSSCEIPTARRHGCENREAQERLGAAHQLPEGRGLHSTTFQLNLSGF